MRPKESEPPEPNSNQRRIIGERSLSAATEDFKDLVALGIETVSDSDVQPADKALIHQAYVYGLSFVGLAVFDAPWFAYCLASVPLILNSVLIYRRHRKSDVEDKRKIRLNIELSRRVKDKLLALQERSDSGSLTEVIRRSVALYDIISAHVETGGEIVLEHTDGTAEKLKLLE